jgi:hypothetical protein
VVKSERGRAPPFNVVLVVTTASSPPKPSSKKPSRDENCDPRGKGRKRYAIGPLIPHRTAPCPPSSVVVAVRVPRRRKPYKANVPAPATSIRRFSLAFVEFPLRSHCLGFFACKQSGTQRRNDFEQGAARAGLLSLRTLHQSLR